RRLCLRLLAGISQFDGNRISRQIGGDQIANAVLRGEHIARFTAHIAQPLRHNSFAIDLKQKVRTTLQVETKYKAGLRQPAWQRLLYLLGQEVRSSEQDTRDRDEQDD